MKVKEMEKKAQELQELRRMREELDAEIAAIEDEIKAQMGDREQITAGAFRISWRTIASSRIDTAALKKAVPEIVAQYMKQTTTRRFVIT